MIGKTISHYKILEKLGEGGMGVVYKAEDTKLKRTVALKFLPSEMMRSAELKRRFLREAQAAAILDHPNICTIYETSEMEGQTFIAMAYIDGYTLQETVEMGPLNVDDALVIAIQVAEGLQEAHEKGIIHRDVKLSNIMITGKGQAKIADFGLAKLLGHTTVTETGKIMGTVEYMSPEQARGETVDHRTDIWSLGVVLYEMITGRKPFDAKSKAAVIHKIIYEEPDRITDTLPSSVEAVVEKMMQKEPRDRYENTAELLADLRAVRAAASVTAKRESPSIAVLPFADMSADKDQEYFCDGLAEELINALTHIKDLKVIARTSAFSFKGKDVNVRDIGKELRVASVLEGSVRKAGNRLRITAQLVDTAEGHHLWSERYDRKMEDVFAIQDEIALAIVDNLKLELLGEESVSSARRHGVGPEVYDLYLRGRYFWSKAAPGDMKKAIEYFEKAIEKDSNYALAYAGMADSYNWLPFLPPFPLPNEVHPKARAAALKAVEIDDTLAETHTSLAVVKILEWKWEEAEEEFRQAIEFNPGYAYAHYYYALHLMVTRRFDEAINEMHRARDLDPFSPTVNRQVGSVLFYANHHDRAIEALQRAIEIAPNTSNVHGFLGSTYCDKGMYKEALAEFEAERRISGAGNPFTATWTALTYVGMGKKSEAQKILDDMLERSKETHVPPYQLANLCFAVGDNDRGFQFLDKAYEEGDYNLCWLGIGPAYDLVRSDPRYIAMLKKIGLEK